MFRILCSVLGPCCVFLVLSHKPCFEFLILTQKFCLRSLFRIASSRKSIYLSDVACGRQGFLIIICLLLRKERSRVASFLIYQQCKRSRTTTRFQKLHKLYRKGASFLISSCCAGAARSPIQLCVWILKDVAFVESSFRWVLLSKICYVRPSFPKRRPTVEGQHPATRTCLSTFVLHSLRRWVSRRPLSEPLFVIVGSIVASHISRCKILSFRWGGLLFFCKSRTHNMAVSKKSVPGTWRHFDVHCLVTPSLQKSKSMSQTFWTHQY
jgi:hypothetical protein